MTKLSFWHRLSILVGLLIAGFLGVLVLDPISQDPEYHRFADTRSFWGIPNFNDVTSNLGFILVGALGIWLVMGRRRSTIFDDRRDVWPYAVFFVGVALVSAGSAYYHWAPSNERLLWDRLPMSIAFMAFCAAIVADRIDARAGDSWVLLILIAVGISSVVYWDWTESLGRGDLRFYGLVQFYPMIAVPIVCWLFPEHRYTSGIFIFWLVAWYGLSKLMEHFDDEIFEFSGHVVSGHSLKHLVAAGATLVVLRMLLASRSTPLRREQPTAP